MIDLLYKIKRRRLIKKYGIDKVSIAGIRKELSYWGHDTSNVTDSEIQKTIEKLQKVFKDTGMSLDSVKNFKL